MTTTRIEQLAAFVAELNYEQIPQRVIELVKHQAAAVLGGIMASADCAAAKNLLRVVEQSGAAGPAALLCSGKRVGAEDAAYVHAAFSIALDFDDYLFMGHTGHSAVNVPLALAQELGADGRTVLAAITAADEIMGRLGASVLIGPHNGQLWTFIHAAGAAAAASRMLGLDAARTAHALALALSQPPFAMYESCMGPDSKLLMAAEPARQGLRAARLAAAGLSGPLDLLDADNGFYRTFSYLPLPALLGGLGRAWVSDSLAFKPYPGCAYVDSTVEALLKLRERYCAQTGRALEPDKVRQVRVRASLLSVEMDRLSARQRESGSLTPAAVNFSIGLSAAIALQAGELTGRQMTAEYLTEQRAALLELAGRVTLEHDPDMTLEVLRAIVRTLEPGGVLRGLGLGRIAAALRRVRHNLHGGGVGPLEIIAVARSAAAHRSGSSGLLRRLIRPMAQHGGLDNVDFRSLTFPFGAQVELQADGWSGSELCAVPAGAPGSADRLEVARHKFLSEAGRCLGAQRSRSALDRLLKLEDADVRRLMRDLAQAG